eukprot:Skav227826  [mRNA]  locus=scaffold948:346316:348318:+ [translate_table: standard]
MIPHSKSCAHAVGTAEEKAAVALKADGVSLAKVDATEEKDLAKRFEVKGTGPAVIESSNPDPPRKDKPQDSLLQAVYEQVAKDHRRTARAHSAARCWKVL